MVIVEAVVDVVVVGVVGVVVVVGDGNLSWSGEAGILTGR